MLKPRINKIACTCREHWLATSLVLLIIPNLIMFVLLYPGYFQADHQVAVIRAYVGEPSAITTLFWTYFALPFCMFMPTYAAYGIAQLTIFVASVIVSVWRLRSCGLVGSGLPLVCLFAFFPTFLLYNLLYSSDICFAYTVMAITAMLAEIVHTRGKVLESRNYLIGLCALLILSCMFRKNALIICVASLLFCIIVLRKFTVRLLGVFLSAIALTMIINAVMAAAVNADSSPSREILSVPATQIAASYAWNADLPPAANEYFTSLHSAEEWADLYESFSADKAKWELEFDMEFLKNYIDLGLSSPLVYLRAYLLLEYPFWQFGATSWGDMTEISNSSSIDFSDYDHFTLLNADGLPENYLAQFGTEKSGRWHIPARIYSIANSYHIPFATEFVDFLMFNRALPFWTIVIGFACALSRRKKGLALDYLTISSAVWATLLAFMLLAPAPLMRYSMEMYYALPICALMILRMYKPHPQSRG